MIHVLMPSIFVVFLAVTTMGQARAPDALALARDHYNAERYDDAIRLAGEAQATLVQRHAAAVVLARAHIERYRLTGDHEDLERSRAALKSVDAAALGARERVELLIALGASLYWDETYSLDDRYSAAAEQFELALAGADRLDAHNRDLLFDWWAGALDRQALQGGEPGRRALYERILERAEQELAHDSASASASYWLAASARGVNDLPRAMGAAVAGWVRAATLGERGEALRLDLDRLMRQVIMPERARELAPDADPRPALALLEAQWDGVKAKWESAVIP